MARVSEYKPLLLTTTVRNPERYKLLLNVLAAFNGKILTQEIIDNIIFNMVKKKLYAPIYATRTPRLKAMLNDDAFFTDADTGLIIANSPQDHKEAGFEKGWASRFDTFFKMAMELGFVYYEMNKPIELSETGVKLVKSIEPEFIHLEKQVFLNAFVKYQRINPFRKVRNDNKPLILLLQTISELKKIYGDSSAGISRQEIPLVLCWKDSDYKALATKIKEIRDRYLFTPSDAYIYNVCRDLLGVTDEKRFKIKNIIREMPDEFIRKMRLTGLISIRGNGRFIDFNTLEIGKINYVLSQYANATIAFSTTRQYFDYMKTMDAQLISLEAVVITGETEKEKLFLKWVTAFNLEQLKEELIVVCNPRASTKNEVLKYISEPVRMEFLTALALKKAYPDLKVVPNYIMDDEGLPSAFAPGGGADIVCYDRQGNILFEVTLLTGAQQNIREMPAIERHLKERLAAAPNSFSIMICPRAHTDTLSYSEWLKSAKKLIVVILEVSAFVCTLGVQKTAREYA
jgi:AlwI restriction endonuclease.